MLVFFREYLIRLIQYTGAVSVETKIHSASWEKVDIPGLITTHM